MTPEQLDKLFRPFTQADRTVWARYGGAGPGLVARHLSKREPSQVREAGSGIGERIER